VTGSPLADPVAEIRRLYFQTSAATIRRDLARAIDLFKRLSTDEQRDRAAVYMDGLSTMRSEWAEPRRPAKKPRR
jgi:hypothetical protein